MLVFLDDDFTLFLFSSNCTVNTFIVEVISQFFLSSLFSFRFVLIVIIALKKFFLVVRLTQKNSFIFLLFFPRHGMNRTGAMSG